MIGMDDDEATFLWAVREGVVGYVLKDASAAEIVRVLRAVANGEAVFHLVSPRRYFSPPPATSPFPTSPPMT